MSYAGCLMSEGDFKLCELVLHYTCISIYEAAAAAAAGEANKRAIVHTGPQPCVSGPET